MAHKQWNKKEPEREADSERETESASRSGFFGLQESLFSGGAVISRHFFEKNHQVLLLIILGKYGSLGSGKLQLTTDCNSFYSHIL